MHTSTALFFLLGRNRVKLGLSLLLTMLAACELDGKTNGPAVCGDGIVTVTEVCDDGNTEPNDGCHQCLQTLGFQCFGAPSVCFDINECVVDNGICGANTTCTNLEGGYLCDCTPGFANCDLVEGNGCESELSTASNHCGTCDATTDDANVCTVDTCVNGQAQHIAMTGATCGMNGVCNASGQCKHPLGTACTMSDMCDGDFCVDGVCCNAGCSGTCDACNVAGSEGTCTEAYPGACSMTCSGQLGLPGLPYQYFERASNAAAFGDINGDGVLDIVLGSYQPYGVRILRGLGDGTFTSYAEYPFERAVTSVAVGDLNDDGRDDLIVTYDFNSLAIYFQQANGTLQREQDVGILNNQHSVVIADFDLDGKTDFATPSWDYQNQRTSLNVFLNQGNKTFALVTQAFAGGTDTIYMGIANVDGDAAPDLVLTGQDVRFLRNQGNGTFVLTGQYPVAYGFRATVPVGADLNHDGKDEIVVGFPPGRTIGVYPNLGDGTFGAATTYLTGYTAAGNPRGLAAADMNEDGHLDLAVSNYSNGDLSIFWGNGIGGFSNRIEVPVAGAPSFVTTTDMDQNGHLDLISVSAWAHVTVLSDRGSGRWQSLVYNKTTELMKGLSAGNLIGDAFIDIAATHYDANAIGIWRNQGNETFALEATYPTGAKPTQVATVDMNGDTFLDLVVVNSVDKSVSVLLANGDGTFAPRIDTPVNDGADRFAVADFDGNGFPDLVVNCLYPQGSVRVLLNQGNGTFAAPIDSTINKYAGRLVTTDVDGDTKPDLVTISTSPNGGINVQLNLGNGQFGPSINQGQGAFSGHFVAGDLNGDGRDDLVLWRYPNMVVMFNNGNGSFVETSTYPSRWSNYTLVDINADGHLDIAAGGSGTMDIWLNKGDGTLFFAGHYTEFSPWEIPSVAADFNFDGRMDLATTSVAGTGTYSLSILFNQCLP